jgi:MFS transporter, ACS family, tartrate transporter
MPDHDPADARVLRKVAWRLIPFMGVLYLVAFLDRVNISFAALTMNPDLAFSATVFGNGAGIFFLGYVLFEVPSNLLLHKVGARRWIARIMISWGLVSTAMVFVQTPWSFYALRFLLGIAEAGFFPGMILYLTYWFPVPWHGRILGAFMVFLPLASVIGAPISTALLDLSLLGLHGWQWLFFLEGAPAVALGFMVLKVLTDRPAMAQWLTPDERDRLLHLLPREQTPSATHAVTTLRALLHPKMWLLCFIYFALLSALYGYNFWLPQIIQSLGALSHREIGLLTLAPNLVAAAAIYGWGRHSDRSGERRWHLALPAFLAAIGLAVASDAAIHPIGVMSALVLGAVGIYATLPVFWTLPTALLHGMAAAGGIALINAVGSVGGYFGPSLVGRLKDSSASYQSGLRALALSLLVAGILALLIGNDRGSVRPAVKPC